MTAWDYPLRLRHAQERASDLQRLAHARLADIDRLTRERDAWAARCVDAEDAVRSLRDLLARNDSVAVAALRREAAMLRETVAALDARNDELRRAVDWWERHHGPDERARQLAEESS